MDVPHRMLSAAEAAVLLGVQRRTIYDLASPSGPIPCYRLGKRCIRFLEQDLLDYVHKCRIQPAASNAARIEVEIKRKLSQPVNTPNCFERLGLPRKSKLRPR